MQRRNGQAQAVPRGRGLVGVKGDSIGALIATLRTRCARCGYLEMILTSRHSRRRFGEVISGDSGAGIAAPESGMV